MLCYEKNEHRLCLSRGCLWHLLGQAYDWGIVFYKHTYLVIIIIIINVCVVYRVVKTKQIVDLGWIFFIIVIIIIIFIIIIICLFSLHYQNRGLKEKYLTVFWNIFLQILH